MEVILFRILLYNLAWTSYGSLKGSLFFLEDSDVSSNFLSALVILVTSFVEILNIRVQIHWSDVAGTMPFFRREEFGRSLALYI